MKIVGIAELEAFGNEPSGCHATLKSNESGSTLFVHIEK